MLQGHRRIYAALRHNPECGIMAQGVNVDTLADAAVQGDLLDGFLHPGPGHDPGLADLKGRLAAGKQQIRVPMRGPVPSQGLERHQGQGHEPVFPALAAAHMDPHQVTVNIGNGQVQGLTQPQAQAVGGEEVNLIAEFTGVADQPSDLLQGKHILQGLNLGWLGDGDVVPGFAEDILIETLQGIAGNLDQTPGAMLDQVHEILLELIGAKLVGTGIEMVAHLSQAAGVQVDGLGAFAPQGEFGEVALVQCLKAGVVVGVHQTSPDRPFHSGRDQGSTDELRLCRVAASFNTV